MNNLFKKKKEKLTVRHHLVLKPTELEFLEKMAEEQMTSKNNLVRKALAEYRKKYEHMPTHAQESHTDV